MVIRNRKLFFISLIILLVTIYFRSILPHQVFFFLFLGIGFIATITAAVSTYFLSNFGDKETTLDDIVKKLDNIEKELEKIKENKK